MASPRAKKRNGMIIAVLIGLLLVGFGVYQMTLTKVECGGETMQQGDICEVTNKGRTSELNYDEQRAAQTRTGWIALGVGVFFLGYAGWTFRSYRKESAEPPAVAAA
jgi:hypothetical protein